jgi:hypothetical protein
VIEKFISIESSQDSDTLNVRVPIIEPPSLASQFHKPGKHEAITKHKSIFLKI